jgi:GH35 family endo-1,4-beta-xylanase
MLRFAVFDENELSMAGAHLLGPDDVPLPGPVKLQGRTIVGRPPTEQQSCGLALLHPAGRCGRLMLSTSLLPQRPEPYLLTVELARARIRSFIAKSEEWQMFDLSEGHPAVRHFEEARRLLTAALTAADDGQADRLARESLEHGIIAGERLTMAHAEILLHRRYAARAASSVTLGVRVWPGRTGKGLQELIASSFDVVVLPVRWKDVEVGEGAYRWEPLDGWMEWARAQGKPIVAGPLVDFSRSALPEWMHVWQHDYDTCRDLVYDFVEKVVQRYQSAVGIWNVASGLNVNDNFDFTEAQMLDLVRTAVLVVRHNRKGARTMVELREPFGEHAALRRNSPAPLTFVDRLTQEGIKFDALGIQLLFGQGAPGRAARDLLSISALLDRLLLLEMPVLVSALGVPSREGAGGDRDGTDNGAWHDAWSPEVQARWVSRLFAIAMSKPFVESVFWSDLYDHADADLPGGGLIDEAGKPKPALARLVAARKRLRKPLGSIGLPDRAGA